MSKYISLLFLIAGIVGIVWGFRVNWADGSWVLALVGTGLFLVTSIINYRRTGKVFTNSSGGK